MFSWQTIAISAYLVLFPMLYGAVTQADEPRKVAVLVGINEYHKSAFENLKFAENDVDEAGGEFQKLGFRTTTVKGRDATREKILSALNDAVKPLGRKDFFILMLCGHGQQLRFVDESGKEHDDGFFCPFDAERGIENRGTLLSLSVVIDKLADNVGTKILLVDACREELQEAGRRGIQGKVVAIPEGTAILFACSAGQRSFEPAGLKHGLFTYCLVDALRKSQATGGDVTWGSVVENVYDNMSSDKMREFIPKGYSQDPIRADALRRTVLARVAKPTAEKQTDDAYTNQSPPTRSSSDLRATGTVTKPINAPLPNPFEAPEWAGVKLVRERSLPEARDFVYRERISCYFRNATNQPVGFYFKNGKVSSQEFSLGSYDWCACSVAMDFEAKPLIAIKQKSGSSIDAEIRDQDTLCFDIVGGKVTAHEDPLPIRISLENLHCLHTPKIQEAIKKMQTSYEMGSPPNELFPRTTLMEFTNRLVQPSTSLFVNGGEGDMEIASGETKQIKLHINRDNVKGTAEYKYFYRLPTGSMQGSFDVLYGNKVNFVRRTVGGEFVSFGNGDVERIDEVLMPPAQLRIFYENAAAVGTGEGITYE